MCACVCVCVRLCVCVCPCMLVYECVCVFLWMCVNLAKPCCLFVVIGEFCCIFWVITQKKPKRITIVPGLSSFYPGTTARIHCGNKSNIPRRPPHFHNQISLRRPIFGLLPVVFLWIPVLLFDTRITKTIPITSTTPTLSPIIIQLISFVI